MDEYDLCNQPKREARREVVKKDLCEKGYKKRTQQNRIYYVVQGCTLAKQIRAYGMCTQIPKSLFPPLTAKWRRLRSLSPYSVGHIDIGNLSGGHILKALF